MSDGMTLQDMQTVREYRTAWFLCRALAELCPASPEVVVDKLTGYLWDEEEAKKIKAGGSGVWGPISMPTHTQFSDADDLALAKYVMAVK